MRAGASGRSTEVGAAYHDKCKSIARQLEEADNLAALMQSRVRGTLRISTSVAFGRRVLTPLVLQFMQQHPELQIDLSFEDRYVNLVEQGMDLALRMGRLADSSLGSRYLGVNHWVLVAAPAYLREHGTSFSYPSAGDERCTGSCGSTSGTSSRSSRSKGSAESRSGTSCPTTFT